MMAKPPEARPTLPVMRQWFASLRPGGAPQAEPEAPQAQRPAWIYAVIALAVIAAMVMSFVVVRAVM
jgi:hypothetical protein